MNISSSFSSHLFHLTGSKIHGPLQSESPFFSKRLVFRIPICKFILKKFQDGYQTGPKNDFGVVQKFLISNLDPRKNNRNKSTIENFSITVVGSLFSLCRLPPELPLELRYLFIFPLLLSLPQTPVQNSTPSPKPQLVDLTRLPLKSSNDLHRLIAHFPPHRIYILQHSLQIHDYLGFPPSQIVMSPA